MKKFSILDFFQLQKEISTKPLKPIYLLYGEEGYLHDMILDEFKNRLQKENYDFSNKIFYGESIDLNHFIDSISSLPLGIEKQCIIIKNFDKIKTYLGEKIEILLKRFSFKDNHQVLLLFSLSKKLPINASFDKIKEVGVIASLQKPRSFQVKQWIQMKCRENKKNITSEAMYYLQSLTDNDLGKVRGELEKIFCYLDENSFTISKKDVIDNLYGIAGGNIFDFVDAIGEKKAQQALSLLKVLEENEFHVLSLLAMISRQIKLILQIKILDGNDEKKKGEIKLPSFVINKLLSQSKNFQLSELKNAFQYLLDAEIKLKTGYFDPVLVLEQLIIKITK